MQQEKNSPVGYIFMDELVLQLHAQQKKLSVAYVLWILDGVC
jgi:hypothetical protein